MDVSHLIAQSNDSTAWVLVAAGITLLTYVMLRKNAKRHRDPLDESPMATPRLNLAQQRAVEREMSNLLVELSEMARQITAQLDTRAAKLELMMREADAKIAALEAATGGRTPSADEEVARPTPAAPPAPQVPHPPEATSFPRLAVPESSDPRHAEVYALADAGQNAHQIAQKLGRPNGEIELILALRAR